MADFVRNGFEIRANERAKTKIDMIGFSRRSRLDQIFIVFRGCVSCNSVYMCVANKINRCSVSHNICYDELWQENNLRI